jgi:hypothetical protein
MGVTALILSREVNFLVAELRSRSIRKRELRSRPMTKKNTLPGMAPPTINVHYLNLLESCHK